MAPPAAQLPLDDACAVHGEAVATVLFLAGTIVLDCGGALPEDEPELDDDSVHGGTIRVVIALFSGTTSVFCWLELPPLDPPELPPLLELAAFAPPGVSSTVEDGGGVLGPPLELELDPELAMHGWTATVCVSEPDGMVTWLEPGGTVVLPDCAT